MTRPKRFWKPTTKTGLDAFSPTFESKKHQVMKMMIDGAPNKVNIEEQTRNS